jgi:hypothetical protein
MDGEYDQAVQKLIQYLYGRQPSYTDTPGRQRYNSLQPQGMSNSLDLHKMYSRLEPGMKNNYYEVPPQTAQLPYSSLMQLMQGDQDRRLSTDRMATEIQGNQELLKDRSQFVWPLPGEWNYGSGQQYRTKDAKGRIM